MMKRCLLLLFSLLLAVGLQAQTRTVTGKVTDQSDGTSLPGVSVLVKGTNQGTVTDVNGSFSIEAAATDVLSFSFIGYESQEVTVGEQTIINVVLPTSIETLQEVVVIGFGERERKDVTGAISTVGSDQLEKYQVMTPQLALQGTVSGVRVVNNSGRPGDAPTINIRGVGTFNNYQPLYVIDGQIIESSTHSNEDLIGTVNLWTLINPTDIESMTILKDAAAAAIYGSRASNGVVLITTKKGKVGTPRIQFNGQWGIQNIKSYDLLNTTEYTALYREAYANHHDPTVRATLPPQFDPASPLYLGNSSTYDWQEAFKNKNAPSARYSIDLSGGTEALDYFISAGYQKQEAVFKGNSLERYSLSTNVNTNIGKFLKAGIIYRLAYQEALEDPQLDLERPTLVPPWQPVYDPSRADGLAPVWDLASTDTTASLSPDAFLYGPETEENGLGFQYYNDSRYEQFRNVGNAYLEVSPFKNLKIRGSVGVDWTYQSRRNFHDLDDFIFSITPTYPHQVGSGASKATYGIRDNRFLNLQYDLLINYTKAFGKHNFDLVLDAQDTRYTRFTTDMGTNESTTDDLDRINVGNVNRYGNAFSERERNQWIGYVGRLSYNFDSKYYLDVSVRRDGSSGFPEGNQFEIFPAVSAAWRVSSESFMQNYAFVNDLKLRAGWGQTGNDRPTRGLYAYLSTLSGTPDYSFGSPGDGIGNVFTGVSLPSFPVRDLKWEKSTTTNIGLDAALLNNRISMTVEYYQRVDDRLLQQVQFPASIGIGSDPLINVAKVKNSGIEIELMYNNQIGDLKFSVGGNLSTVRNRVLSVYNDQPFGGELGRIEKGYPLNYLWGYKVGGIFQSDQDIQDYLGVNDVPVDTLRPGDMYFQDLHGSPNDDERFYSATPDSVINELDRTYIGKTIPGITYGINVNLGWKNFDLSLQFYGEGDVDRYSRARRSGESMSSQGIQQWPTISERWTEANPSTSMPRAVYGDPANNNRFSDRWVESGAFLRLANWQLGYSIPTSILEKTRAIAGVRIFVGGQNNLLFTKYTGIDPANDYYPLPQTFLFGVNARF